MNKQIGILVLVVGILAWADAGAFREGGCVQPRETMTEIPPIRGLPPSEPRILTAIHRTDGLRTAGSGTRLQRTFRLRASGYLSAAETEGYVASSRFSRSRAAVSFTLSMEDWGKQVRIVVDSLADFRIILRSDNPASFDSFAFVDVHPGTYAFSLDSLNCWREPVDVDLEYRGRIIATRTVRPEVMAHPVPALEEDQKTRAPREALHVSQSR